MEQTKLGESTDHPKRHGVDEFREKYRGKRDNLDEVRHIEGFPVGEDEDIHRLSDPPYYTAYPNPHIKEFIERFGKPYDENLDSYNKPPLVGDTREGKNNPIYALHTYHTKVPHTAILKFVKHYTSEGDIVLDAFCGSGMTGIACSILARHCLLTELSPFASFLSYAYNIAVDPKIFKVTGQEILTKVEEQLGEIYQVDEGNQEGEINYTILSERFICPYCRISGTLWEVLFDLRNKKFKDKMICGNCGSELTQRELEKERDENGCAKRVPVWISINIGGKRKAMSLPDSTISLPEEVDVSAIPYWHPTTRMMFKGENWGDMYVKTHHTGMSRVTDFFTPRNLLVLAKLWNEISKYDGILQKKLEFVFTSIIPRSSLLNRMRPSLAGDPMTGTLYVASLVREENVLNLWKRKVDRIAKGLAYFAREKRHSKLSVQTSSTTDLQNVPTNCIDYIFVDPPFGRNLMYSELNFIWESWFKVFTNNEQEAIKNNSQNKNVDDYRKLICRCFKELFRVLKPNRWITVVFHNSEAIIWNAIQDSLARAGFVVAQVAVLDKQQGSYKQVVEAGSVRNDLIINAYKPKTSFSRNFLEKAGYGLERDFVEEHLEKLPVDQNVERTEKMLYSKMLAYYIQHGYEINMNASEFYSMLRKHFEERDGYWFLYSQVDIYEERKRKASLTSLQATLLISDERSAIQWLNWFLSEPRGYDEIYPEFVQVLTTTPDKVPELRELLGENFVSIDGNYRRPRALEKEEIEERRNKRLLREFEGYLEKAVSGRKLDSVRKEAVLAGFIVCYREKRFQDILTVARKIPRQIIESSTEIYDLIDVAETKIGDTK